MTAPDPAPLGATVHVPLGARAYDIAIGPGLLAEAPRLIAPHLTRPRLAILTEERVAALHLPALREAFAAAGIATSALALAPGEATKGWRGLEQATEWLIAEKVERDDLVLAFGGGVIGDLAGFAAAILRRGVGFVQAPTTLLAQVDSSVGGKTGVDLPEGKNLAGVFLRPRLVAADLAWLDSLPDAEISHGLAEVVKMGLLAGGDYFSALERTAAARNRDPDALLELVLQAVRFKAAVVAEDEREAGRRAILNYGHTIGHGLEAAADYKLPHGQAVAVGMMAAARLSHERYGADLTPVHRDLLAAAGLPASVSGFDAEKVLRTMSRDKKRRHDPGSAASHRFVLLEAVGSPAWDMPVTEEEVLRVMETIVD